MNKAVMISIQPKWCELIASGKKTIEVRKTIPKIDTPFKCYIYMTMNGLSSMIAVKTKQGFVMKETHEVYPTMANGRVIGEFVCDKIDNIDIPYPAYFSEVKDREELETKTCLTLMQMHHYSKDNLYGWQISDLKIYDKPKELSEFKRLIKCKDWYNGMSGCEDVCGCYENGCCINGIRKNILTRPPQSWCYVEELEE